MFKYFLSLSGFERLLLVIGIVSLSIVIINILIEVLEIIDKGVRQKKRNMMAILFTMIAVCLFSFLTLFLIAKGITWYMAYPIAVLAILIYSVAALIFMGVSHLSRIRPPKIDKRVAIGHTGLVYKTVSPDDSTGCVSVDIFGSTIDSFAISATGESIPIGTIVKIIDLDEDVLVCTDEQKK